MQVCNDISRIYLSEDVMPPCTYIGKIDVDHVEVKVCIRDATVKISGVFEYEN